MDNLTDDQSSTSGSVSADARAAEAIKQMQALGRAMAMGMGARQPMPKRAPGPSLAEVLASNVAPPSDDDVFSIPAHETKRTYTRQIEPRPAAVVSPAVLLGIAGAILGAGYLIGAGYVGWVWGGFTGLFKGSSKTGGGDPGKLEVEELTEYVE